jgi:hypothetical protein
LEISRMSSFIVLLVDVVLSMQIDICNEFEDLRREYPIPCFHKDASDRWTSPNMAISTSHSRI